MYMDYTDDDYHDEYKLPFDSENFGIFKKFSNDRVRREGYLFANPAVTIGVGAEYCGISVTCDAHFNFDTDFRFTAKGVDAYGDLTYNLTWSFKAFGFTLYSLTLPDGLNKYNVDTKFNTVPIFHTDGVSGHINFDYEVEPTLNAALSGALRNAPAQSLGHAFSLIAYLFYEDGVWSDTGDAYTEEELSYFENPEEYKRNWYGQRFLETRLDLSGDVTPRVAESSAIGYNGLALFSYVADWDDDLTTANDRDIFLQIYNFSEDSFSHIIRITEESGAYSLPTLVRSDNGTYLFYGEKGQAKESGCIRYLNVSYVIQNGLYEKIAQGDNEYYVLRATRSAVTTDSPDGEGMSLPAETVAITADKAVDCGSLSDFDAFVSSDGRMYLLWTALNPETGASDIYASILNSEDESLNEAENGAESQAAWSDAVILTDGGPGAYYSNLDVIGSKNGMIIVSGKGQFMDAAANGMVQIKHTPYGKLTLDNEITVDNPYAAAGDNVHVTATLRNAGLDTFAPDADGVNVIFRVNGEEVERIAYDKPIPGGTSVELSASVEIPDAPQTVISVECDGLSAQKTLDKSYVLTLDEENSGIRYAEPDPRTNVSETLYAATLVNHGNEISPQVDFTVTADKRALGSEGVTEALCQRAGKRS